MVLKRKRGLSRYVLQLLDTSCFFIVTNVAVTTLMNYRHGEGSLLFRYVFAKSFLADLLRYEEDDMMGLTHEPCTIFHQ